jgi:hypothetical protein
MAYANRYTGEELVVKATPTGGAELTLTGDYTSFSWDETMDNAEVTAGNEEDKSHLPTKKGMSWELTAFAGDYDTWNDFRAVRTGVMTVYPKGEANALPYFSFPYVLSGINNSTATDAAEEQTISGERNGSMVVDFDGVQGAIPHLHFQVEPVNTAADAIIPVTVYVRDATNTLIATDQTTLVTIAIGTNPPGTGVLSGIVSVRVINGVAQFGNLSIDDAGSGYTLVASAPGRTSDTSTTFNIT